jgi:uncharacterized protein (DUF2141 family)
MTARRHFPWLYLVPAAFCLLALLSCAKVGMPPGGPEDKIGPSVVASYPSNNAVTVPRKLVARLVFSKPVNKASVEAALFLSPDPRQRLMYRWRGQTLELIYLDSLLENRTYVISVGSQAKDLRGNPVGESITIAFSTGISIDRGAINGWLADVAAPQAVNLWAYPLNGDSVPDPIVTPAEYRLQAGSDGHFRLDYLRAGRYRVFAVNDRNHDGLWNPASERIGIPPWDVTVRDSSSVPWLSFRLESQDTTPVAVRAVREVHERLIDVRLSRDIASLQTVLLSATGDSNRQLAAYPDTSGRDLWHVFPDQALTAGAWRVFAGGTDLFGHSWSGSDTLTARARPDTARPKILHSDPATRGRARIAPPFMRLEFDKPVAVDSLAPWDFFFVKADTDSVETRVRIDSARFLDLTPSQPFAEGVNYRLRFNGKLVHDLSDNLFFDTTMVMGFSIYYPDSLGTLEGSLVASAPGPYVVRVLTLKGNQEVASATPSKPGSFVIDRLTAGKYLLEVIRDTDGNGVYSYGRFQPFQFAEPFILSPDTITIRARWQFEQRVVWPETR